MHTTDHGYISVQVRNCDPFPHEVVSYNLAPEQFKRAWQCMEAIAGIADPAAFVAKVRELVALDDAVNGIDFDSIMDRIRELAKLLPPETP